MDTLRGLDEERNDLEQETLADVDAEPDHGIDDTALDIGSDERRMHVRAYNHWVSLLKGRAYPSIEDLDPESIVDFGPNSVLLDFTGGLDDPAVQYLGRSLRDECGLDRSIRHISEVPGRSLLSRLTDHYLQIIANRAPIGFEAEFVGTRGHTTVYRGILMPFSSDDDTIDFIYGVINWKEMVDAAAQARLEAEVEAAMRDAPRSLVAAPAWADGPNHEAINATEATALGESLADRLLFARETAAAARAADTRSRAALYRALGRAHDFGLAADADPEGYATLLAEAGITVQARAPFTAVAKLVFGIDYDKTRLTEFAAVLAHARRNDVPEGALAVILEAADGGIKAIVALERAARRPAALKPRDPAAKLKGRTPLGTVALPAFGAAGDLILLVARVAAAGEVEVLAQLDDAPLLGRAIRAAA